MNTHTYQYPYQNLSLDDMEDEIWQFLPGYFEVNYMISNKGRVKSLSHRVEYQMGRIFVSYIKEGKMLKQSVAKKYNTFIKQYNCSLKVGVYVDGKSVTIIVSRSVYQAFTGQIPQEMIILHKNDDPFDNRVENLYVSTHKTKSIKCYAKNREGINARKGLFSEKIVSQFNLKGNYLATFSSIAKAAQAINAEIGEISYAVMGRKFIVRGYYWREGEDTNPIDVSVIEKKKFAIRELASSRLRKKIVQYSLSGNYMATFDSIKMASIATGLTRNAIFKVLNGGRFNDREFIWKYADSFETIPPVIEVPVQLPPPACPVISRKKMNLPVYDYPYQDLYLADMENEVWKDLPGLETYCMVSNMGRVKSLSRFIDRPGHGRLYFKEQIIRQYKIYLTIKSYSSVKSQYLYFSLQIGSKRTRMPVAQAVYTAFIKSLTDFNEVNIRILHHDLNPFNNRVENLYAATRSET